MINQEQKLPEDPMDATKQYYQLEIEQEKPVDEESPLVGRQRNAILHSSSKSLYPIGVGASLTAMAILIFLYFNLNKSPAEVPMLNSAWSSKAAPFSTVDPTKLGFYSIERPEGTKPGKIFGKFLDETTALPTSAWYENFLLGYENDEPENKVFAVPYIIDTSGTIPGIRTHSCYVQALDRQVLMIYEPESGLSLGAVETFHPQHFIHKHKSGNPVYFSQLAVELEWLSEKHMSRGEGPRMESPVVRGSPYSTMKYYQSTPKVKIQRQLSGPIVVDNKEKGKTLVCGEGEDQFSAEPVMVEKELKLQFDTSDQTWLVFVSNPTEFVCSNGDGQFELRGVEPMHRGMVRVAMANNCTTGQNAQYCGPERKPVDSSKYESLLRKHAEVYPTAQADIEFTFPVESSVEEVLRLNFKWRPSLMSNFVKGDTNDDDTMLDFDGPDNGLHLPSVELLTFSLPHHQERLVEVIGSSNKVIREACQLTIHGYACPALGSSWSLIEHLHRTEFMAPRAPRVEMIPSIQKALKHDIKYEIPLNYQLGAGDTYFSGKMLAKLGRILLVAEEVGGVSTSEFHTALGRLRAGVEVWLNGTAESPFMYDRAWGGLIMCGCNYAWTKETGGHCMNHAPQECPALTDFGQNFGAGYYNDHHYHYGYHIYAAAVLSRFDPVWARKFHQHVLLLIRDIANPSIEDPYFPVWRHKDWYAGHSWASGVVTIQGKPYPNGRNQESVSESISAYEAVALYGDTMAGIFSGSANKDDAVLLDSALRMRDMGRLLMATEIRSARMYWQVRHRGAKGTIRIYPDNYLPKIVGMIWNLLVQEQTWFGMEEWKSYGIQLMPITAASELRDSKDWVKEMLPVFAESCKNDLACITGGWSVLLYTSIATIGKWQEAWQKAETIPLEAFDDAGGNGHSLSNTLWYISTRPGPEAPDTLDSWSGY